jgi:hypothetical protein
MNSELENGPAPDARYFVRVKHAAPLPVSELGPGDFLFSRAQNAHAVRRRVERALDISQGRELGGTGQAKGRGDAASSSQGTLRHATIHAIGAAIEPAMQFALELVGQGASRTTLSLSTTTSSVVVADEWLPREEGSDSCGAVASQSANAQPIIHLRYCSAIHLRITAVSTT